MTESLAIEIGRQGLIVALKVAAPILGFGLIVGLSIGIFQAVTQIHELTLTFVPKIIVTAIVLLIFTPWMLETLITFARRIFTLIGTL